MSDVKWIKMATNIFDNRKIRQIECLPDGDAIIVIWMKLLCLAGNINDSGMVYFTKEIPYTDQMMATQFNRPIATVQMAMRTFEQFGMVEIINDMLHISNWEKYQNIEGMDKIREQNRIRKQKQRERQKLLLEDNSHVKSRDSHATDKNRIEEEKNRKDKDKKKSVKETQHALFERLLPDYLFSDALQAKISEWITYKAERKESYQEQGLKTLLRRLENNRIEYGEQAVMDLIDESMSNGWKGIIFDRLQQRQPQKTYNAKNGERDILSEWRNS